jgi:hypothetical protein
MRWLAKEKKMSLYDTEKYEVILSEDETVVLGEDGQYHAFPGYAVRNKETQVVEHTTMMLPGAIFQCQHFNDTLVSLTTPVATADNVVDLAAVEIGDDVVPS